MSTISFSGFWLTRYPPLRYDLEMNSQPASQPPAQHFALNDFELVRNAQGAWLLVVPHLPEVFFDNPLHDISARLEETQIVIESISVQLSLNSILASHYTRALRDDAPTSIILSAVNDEGIEIFSRRLRLKIV